MASYLRSFAERASEVVFDQFGGRFHDLGPENIEESLSEEAQALYHEVFQDVDCSRIIDYHVHLVGQETERTGCYCHPSLLEGNNVLQRFKANCFLSAMNVKRDDSDEAYLERLMSLCENGCPPRLVERDGGHWRMCGLALDYAHDTSGDANPGRTSLHIPNDYSYDVACKRHTSFIPTCSIHPYRADAVTELKRCCDRGVRLIKWLPNSQDLNPASAQCDAFYDAVREMDMVILSHTGDEHSLTAGSVENSYGNPLLLKRALDRGCKIIMAHCASEGTFLDLEASEPERRRRIPGVDLMIRMMSRPEYEGLLFADISAVIGTLRAKHLKTILSAEHIHDRLVYGSDYPVPAINVVSSTKQLWMLGLITWKDAQLLNEIYRFNPLVYDFAVKRKLSFEGHRFPVTVFQEHPKLIMTHWRKNAPGKN
eukprot:scpid68976/ scgid13724/ 